MARIFVRPGVEMRKLTLFAACATSLAACGSPPPNAVGVFVETFPPGASCIVSRGDQPIGQIDQTPGIATVPNQEADYLVSCRRSGFEDVGAVVHARAVTTLSILAERPSTPKVEPRSNLRSRRGGPQFPQTAPGFLDGNHLHGGRGVYFEDPNGHVMEIITHPYGDRPEQT